MSNQQDSPVEETTPAPLEMGSDYMVTNRDHLTGDILVAPTFFATKFTIEDSILPGWLVEARTQLPKGEVAHYLGFDDKTGVLAWTSDRRQAARFSMHRDALAFSRMYQILRAPNRESLFKTPPITEYTIVPYVPDGYRSSFGQSEVELKASFTDSQSTHR